MWRFVSGDRSELGRTGGGGHLFAVSQELLSHLLAAGERVEAIVGHLDSSARSSCRSVAPTCRRPASCSGTAECAWRPWLASCLAGFPGARLPSPHEFERGP